MAGVFGIVAQENSVRKLSEGISYLQHRAKNYCGLGYFDGKDLLDYTHGGLVEQNFFGERLKDYVGDYGIGSVSFTREPVSVLSKSLEAVITFDGNIINKQEVKEQLLREGVSFDGYHKPEDVGDVVLISKIISKELNFEKGIEELTNRMNGDFSILSLTKEGIYAARGWGRKPLILGKNKENESYAVSSESNAFSNLGIEIVRDVEPGEIVFLDKQGIHNVMKLDLKPIKYGTFEWIYFANPASVIDGQSVFGVRRKIGELLSKRYEIDADVVAPIPNSGRLYAEGYAEEARLPLVTAFVKNEHFGRSFIEDKKSLQKEGARKKLTVVSPAVKDKRIIILDDSLVTGSQTENQTNKLKKAGAKEVSAIFGCPPLKSACKYGKTGKQDEDCIARRMSVEEIKLSRGLDFLGYATIEDLEQAISKPREELCLDCWGF